MQSISWRRRCARCNRLIARKLDRLAGDQMVLVLEMLLLWALADALIAVLVLWR